MPINGVRLFPNAEFAVQPSVATSIRQTNRRRTRNQVNYWIPESLPVILGHLWIIQTLKVPPIIK
jgi:hypothetical protein